MKTHICPKCGLKRTTLQFHWSGGKITGNCKPCYEKEKNIRENKENEKLLPLQNIVVKFVEYKYKLGLFNEDIEDVYDYLEVTFHDMTFDEFYEKTKERLEGEDIREIFDNAKIANDEQRKMYLLHKYPNIDINIYSD